MPLLIEGDLEGLLALFGNSPRINDPRLGWVEQAKFELFVATSAAGLAERHAQVEHLATTYTARAAVEECILSLVRRGHVVRLPVALAAVIVSDVLTSLHVYHSSWPLTGAHAIRSPILDGQPGIQLPGALERCNQKLAEADVQGVLDQFDCGAVLREPEGEDVAHRGREELRRYFGRLLARGGISFERCSLTDDGSSFAVEYNLTACGDAWLPHQAGIAVCDRARTGLLAAVRLYDDMERPAATP